MVMFFSLERRHNVKFHPFVILRHHWLSMFTFLFTSLFIFLFTWKVVGDLNLNEIWIQIEFELEGFFELFLKQFLGSPCYLIVVSDSGGSFFLREIKSIITRIKSIIRTGVISQLSYKLL